jgi:hypothetical protein
MEWWLLRQQLVRVLPKSEDESPYVFEVPRADAERPRVWAVAYRLEARYGIGGARTIVDSFVVESGKARLVGAGGVEMNGQRLTADPIRDPMPNSILILGHGIISWTSGHNLPSQAVLYRVNVDGVKSIWRFNSPSIEFEGSNGNGFAISYHDEHRHEKNLPSSAYDVYAIPTDGSVPQRVVHKYE